MTVDATNVYWTQNDGTIMSVPISGGNVTTLAAGQTAPSGIAVDATSVYWVTRGNGNAGGTVMRRSPK